jgi:TatD DNase family protein
VARQLPPERLLVETDSPYLSPVPVRGRRNEPTHVVHTLTCPAQLQGVAPDALAAHTTHNARALFGLAGRRRILGKKDGHWLPQTPTEPALRLRDFSLR